MFNNSKFKVFDAHLHTYGTFLRQEKDLISYMDKYNVQKAILTTINRQGKTKLILRETKDQSEDGRKNIESVIDNFKNVIPKGQLTHQDVIDIANKAPERFYKFFWFNPKIKSEEEEDNYKILEDHLNKGFSGVKIHSSLSPNKSTS